MALQMKEQRFQHERKKTMKNHSRGIWGGRVAQFSILGYLRGWMWPFGCWMKNHIIPTTRVFDRLLQSTPYLSVILWSYFGKYSGIEAHMGNHDRWPTLTFKMAAMWKQKDWWIQKTSTKLQKTKKW